MSNDYLDDFDNLDTYDVDIADDPFRSPSPDPNPRTANGKRKGGAGAGLGLGLDEEVSVAKRTRVPNVKLDGARLLSVNGIPKLRERAARLQFKGKGHEFSDAARLLSLYQLWLDDLFPKARFLDALAMVEKAGHKKIMIKARRDWIDEGRTKDATGGGSDEQEQEHGHVPVRATANAPSVRPALANPPLTPPRRLGIVPDDDDLYGSTPGARPLFGLAQTDLADVGPPADDEDLDALMAEAEADNVTVRKNAQGEGGPQPPLPPPLLDEFADDETAMADMDDMMG